MPRRSAASPFGFAVFAATGLLLAAAALAAEVQPDAKAASASRSLLQTAPAMPPPLPAQRSVAPASQPPPMPDDEGDDEPAQRAAAPTSRPPASQPPALSDEPAERAAAPPADLLQLRDPGEFTPKDYRGFKNGLCCENFSGNKNACKVSRSTTTAASTSSTSRRAARARGTDTHFSQASKLKCLWRNGSDRCLAGNKSKTCLRFKQLVSSTRRRGGGRRD